MSKPPLRSGFVTGVCGVKCKLECASTKLAPYMTNIKLDDGESIEAALCRFKRKVNEQYGARWYKKRLGYFEKPSALKRKRKKMKNLVSCKTRPSLWLKVGQKERYRRNGPNNAAGK